MSKDEQRGIVPAQIQIDPSGEFAAWLAQMRAKAAEFAEAEPACADIPDEDTYRWAKRHRAAARAIAKEITDGRSIITKALDEAKRAVLQGAREASAPVDAIDATDKAAIAAYEERCREAKRERLREYWEETYPALALCIDGEPLLPFEEVFDPEWTRLMSKTADDRDARAAMDEVADTVASGVETLRLLGVDGDLLIEAAGELCRTRDLNAAVKRAQERQRMRDSVRRVMGAQDVAPVLEELSGPESEADPEPVSEPMPEPARPSGWTITVRGTDPAARLRAEAALMAARVEYEVTAE